VVGSVIAFIGVGFLVSPVSFSVLPLSEEKTNDIENPVDGTDLPQESDINDAALAYEIV